MNPRVLRMTSKGVEVLLHSHGYKLVSQKGSHRKWRHPKTGLQVIVPQHKGRELPLGTSRSILINAEIPESKWKV